MIGNVVKYKQRAGVGTDNRGEKNNTSKLNRHQVREIRDRASKGERTASIHKDFLQVTLQAICAIIKRKTWRWLDEN